MLFITIRTASHKMSPPSLYRKFSVNECWRHQVCVCWILGQDYIPDYLCCHKVFLCTCVCKSALQWMERKGEQQIHICSLAIAQWTHSHYYIYLINGKIKLSINIIQLNLTNTCLHAQCLQDMHAILTKLFLVTFYTSKLEIVFFFCSHTTLSAFEFGVTWIKLVCMWIFCTENFTETKLN